MRAARSTRSPRVPARAKVAVGGDSFGGYLAAHVDHDARESRLRRPDLQVLIYPSVDMTLTSPSIDRLAEGYVLTKALMDWFRDHYLQPTDDVAGSPSRSLDRPRGHAPPRSSTAGFDPLVDEGNAWARPAAQRGVPVRHRHELG